MPYVISASRRTDIPAFYSDWFVRRLKQGSAFVMNPYSRKYYPVSLKPEDVSAIAFWSKNYEPLLGRLADIEKTTKNLFFHYTITANSELEPHVPDYRDSIRTYQNLAHRYSPDQIVWRYDPICVTDKLSFEVHEERFAKCAELLKGHARRCIISFAHPYKKVLLNLRKHTNHAMLELSAEKKREYARSLAKRAAACGIQMSACCNDTLLSDQVLKAQCIDGRELSRIFQISLETKPAATREECACTKSVDIGAYDTCGHGCVYCYANSDGIRAKETAKRQQPDWNALGSQVDERIDGAREGQQSLFTPAGS